MADLVKSVEIEDELISIIKHLIELRITGFHLTKYQSRKKFLKEHKMWVNQE